MASEQFSLTLGRTVFVDGFESTSIQCASWTKLIQQNCPSISPIEFSYNPTGPYGRDDTNEHLLTESDFFANQISAIRDDDLSVVAYSLGAVIAVLGLAKVLGARNPAAATPSRVLLIAPPFTPHDEMPRIFRKRGELPIPIMELTNPESEVRPLLVTSLDVVLKAIPNTCILYSEFDRYCPLEPARLGAVGTLVQRRAKEIGIRRRSRKRSIAFHKRLKRHPSTTAVICGSA